MFQEKTTAHVLQSKLTNKFYCQNQPAGDPGVNYEHDGCITSMNLVGLAWRFSQYNWRWLLLIVPDGKHTWTLLLWPCHE